MNGRLPDTNVSSELRRPKLDPDEVRRMRHTFSQPDPVIAATALHSDMTLVARDAGGFDKTGVGLLDPWQAPTP